MQFAHQRLVVHRDIKPHNVLVQNGVPKLLDFGLAKLLVAPEDEATFSLVRVLRLMTPAYASPEQIRGDFIDVRTDVYSLGILLHELLTGANPFPSPSCESPNEATLLESRNVVGRPSDLATRADDATARALMRGTTPDRLARQLSGDLDTIVQAALAFDPERRYATVARLSDDIRFYIQRRPIKARRDSAIYRARKFVTRHRYAVTAASMALVTAAGVSAFTVMQSARVAKERDRAESALARMEKVNRFLTDMFSEADPRSSRGEPLTAEGMLDKAAVRLTSQFQDVPEMRGQLLQVVANVYKQLGRFDDAEQLTMQALPLRARDTLAYAASSARPWRPARKPLRCDLERWARITRTHWPCVRIAPASIWR